MAQSCCARAVEIVSQVFFVSGRCAAVSKFALTKRHLLRVIAASAVLIVPLSQSRADWPERPITIIVPFGQGGATDLLGRLLAAKLTMRLGRQVTVENSVGEVGNVGLRAAAKATPNGYTLLVGCKKSNPR